MRGRIEIVSASAGSGKTYKLANLLEEELAAERVRPENVLATTFTRRAAAELQSRARRRLLEAGRADDAQALAAARIGTVHAVCGRIVSDFAFELGLAPDLEVLDEVAAKVAFRRALTRVVESSPEAEELDEVCQRFPATAPRGASGEQWRIASRLAYDWRAAVGEVVENARMNGLEPDAFSDCAERSLAGMLALLSEPVEGAETLDEALVDGLQSFVDDAPCPGDRTAKTQKALGACRAALPRLRRGVKLTWVEWVRLAKLEPGKKSQQPAAELLAAAAAHDRHPRLHADLKTLVRGVFRIAERAVERYADYKRERGAIDYGDHEVHALRALRLPAVREQLSAELELVLVDEFQDTSPIQLAIFVELAALAPRSVWVGDQKQSIYAFRGADPALMDAVVAAVVGDGEPETLRVSYRSRPGLVRLCSELFAHSFAPQGIRPAQVRLEPHLDPEPAGLGPCVERWNLEARKKAGDQDAIAGLVAELLADPAARVRDAVTGDPRRVRAGDVAILCRYNDSCDAMAHALAARGLSADLRRTGLLGTLEGQLALAGLALFVDPWDRSAAARVVRLLQEDPAASDWLEAALTPREEGGEDPLLAHETVRRVLAARCAHPEAGPLVALDLVLEALDAREQALRWGDSSMRLANLDALREHAAALVGRAGEEAASQTPAGLLEALRDLARQGDAQALQVDGEGVVVSTWHATKGLEFPITVLYELGGGEGFHPFDVQPATDREGFSFEQPLDGRWVRFWPNPYGGHSKGVPFLDRLADDPAARTAREMTGREALRVLYVGMTRARDRIVLACRPGELPDGDMARLVGADDLPLVTEPAAPGERTEWAGVELDVLVRTGVPADPVAAAPVPGAAPVPAGPREHSDAFLSPSGVEAPGSVLEVVEIGPRLALRGTPDMQALGEALHGFLAADRVHLDRGGRLALAADLLARWGVAGNLDAEDVLRASDALRAWADVVYPGAAWHREHPLQHRLANGTVMRGTADLVLMAEGEVAVVDHKSFPGGRDEAFRRAAGFAGQLGGYAQAMRAATGADAVSTWVHLPVNGMMVRVAIAEAPK